MGGFKEFVVKSGFSIFGKTLCKLGKYDSRFKKEVDSLPDDYSLILRVSDNGPVMALQKRDGHLTKLVGEPSETCTIITFKCLGAAFLMMTGKLGIIEANAQHRFTLKGEISLAMTAMRAMVIAVGYLMPGSKMEKESSTVKVMFGRG